MNTDEETRLAKLEERVTALDRLCQQQLEAVEAAIRLQAREYARRLDELNHSHAQAVQDRAGFITRPVCELQHRELAVWKSSIEKEMALARGKILGWVVAIGGVAVLAQLVLRLVPLLK